MAARRSSINLLPKSEFELSYWGRFLKWALTTGRYIIILTEILVIAAFMSRFWLDQSESDLNDRLLRNQQVLKSAAGVEERFRVVQSRMLAADELISKQTKPGDMLDLIANAMPAAVQVSGLTVSGKQVVVAAQARTEDEIGVWLNNMVAQKKWKSITLNDLSSEGESEVKFSFTAYGN
jgi:Tfp pilus assembly protein PilN